MGIVFEILRALFGSMGIVFGIMIAGEYILYLRGRPKTLFHETWKSLLK